MQKGRGALQVEGNLLEVSRRVRRTQWFEDLTCNQTGMPDRLPEKINSGMHPIKGSIQHRSCHNSSNNRCVNNHSLSTRSRLPSGTLARLDHLILRTAITKSLEGTLCLEPDRGHHMVLSRPIRRSPEEEPPCKDTHLNPNPPCTTPQVASGLQPNRQF